MLTHYHRITPPLHYWSLVVCKRSQRTVNPPIQSFLETSIQIHLAVLSFCPLGPCPLKVGDWLHFVNHTVLEGSWKRPPTPITCGCSQAQAVCETFSCLVFLSEIGHWGGWHLGLCTPLAGFEGMCPYAHIWTRLVDLLWLISIADWVCGRWMGPEGPQHALCFYYTHHLTVISHGWLTGGRLCASSSVWCQMCLTPL